VLKYVEHAFDYSLGTPILSFVCSQTTDYTHSGCNSSFWFTFSPKV